MSFKHSPLTSTIEMVVACLPACLPGFGAGSPSWTTRLGATLFERVTDLGCSLVLPIRLQPHPAKAYPVNIVVTICTVET